METAVISWGMIFYNRIKFQSNPFSLSKVIHSGLTIRVCKMKNETSFEIRAYIKGRVGLNVTVSQIHSELCQIHGTSVVSERSDMSPCDLLLSSLLKNFLIVIMSPECKSPMSSG